MECRPANRTLTDEEGVAYPQWVPVTNQSLYLDCSRSPIAAPPNDTQSDSAVGPIVR